MTKSLRVGLVGDYSNAVTAHRAIPRALRIASAVLGCDVEETWLPTAGLAESGAIDLSRFGYDRFARGKPIIELNVV